MIVEIVRDTDLDDIDVFEPKLVPLSDLHAGGRTCDKVVCVECRHQVNPRKVVWGPDGAVCPGCRDDS